PAGTAAAPAGTAAAPGGAQGPLRLAYVDCGHVAPYLIRADGGVSELEPEPSLPLGLGELAQAPRTEQRAEVPADARVLLCTDGVVEARSPGGEFFPLAERLDRWAALPTPQLLRRLREDLDAHTRGRLEDDAAVLIMERPEQPPARHGGNGG
ncbi:PP2C family protein-serine/threonine phosphatase, partial [Streptomyces sp. B1866]|uniref:PP2C family protein-serine/threonine phosphatase n=1 Tax=Streptomyces sp. B1866 TaxID=3075431 RepID=UPI00288F9B09